MLILKGGIQNYPRKRGRNEVLKGGPFFSQSGDDSSLTGGDFFGTTFGSDSESGDSAVDEAVEGATISETEHINRMPKKWMTTST